MQPQGKSQGYKAGVTLAGLAAAFIVIGGTIFYVKRRKARKAREAALAAPLVVGGIGPTDPEAQVDGASSSASSLDSVANAKKQHAV